LVLTAPPLALLAVAHGTLLGALLLARPRRAGPRQVLWCAALWAGWEYVRTLVFPYYPAAVLGLSQHATVAVLQLASLTGVAGVSFVLLSRFVAEHGTPLLAGGPGAARSARRGVAHFNSAHLITPGHGMRSYHKRRLVPLAERWSSLLGSPPPELASLEAGEEATVFSLGDTAFGVLICFEITDAAGARALARGGARFIVNMTNDAWFIGSARP